MCGCGMATSSLKIFILLFFAINIIVELTLLPSISKWVKLTVIFHCGGAKTSQMQFLFGG